MSDRAQFIVLCEDSQSYVFIYRALVRAGAKPARIVPVPVPATVAGGAGHGYVVAKYPAQVKAFRTRNAKASTGLVVHIDADPTHTVAQRHAQLAASLGAASGSPREPGEPIAELIPKRNIETWIHALDETLAPNLARPLDEEQAYPKLEYESGGAAASVAFADHARANTLPEVARVVPSLVDGIAEFRRLP